MLKKNIYTAEQGMRHNYRTLALLSLKAFLSEIPEPVGNMANV